MIRHVDVVKNEPLAGIQRRLVTLVIDGEELQFRAGAEEQTWRERLERLAGPLDALPAEDWIARLAERLAGSTYIAVTDAHFAEDCPFADGDELRVEGPPAAAPHRRLTLTPRRHRRSGRRYSALKSR